VERYVVFEGPVFDLWEASGLLVFDPPVTHLDPVHVWNAEFDRLQTTSSPVGTTGALEEACRLQDLLARIIRGRELGREVAPEDERWLSTAFSLLDAGGSSDEQELDLVAIAQRMALSYDGFRKRFRRLSGVSPGRYRLLRKIDHARRLIQREQLTNKEVAESLGFCDEHHFSRRFKQVTGKSPREFRRTLPA
jgi:AraC-like DNA-binding protein